MVQILKLHSAYTIVLLALIHTFGISAQGLDDLTSKGVTQRTEASCKTVTNTFTKFLSNRGLKLALDYSGGIAGWKCSSTATCIMFKNARPRTATGKPLNRGDVDRNYLQDPSAADFKPKNLTHGYWAVPDFNFVMGASLRLEQKSPGCSVLLLMSFGLGGAEFLGILLYGLYTWPIPPDNGRLQREYMAAMVKELPR